jgi:acyl carrier protein
MERSEIETRLIGLLVEDMGIDRGKITMEASFDKDLEIDSLGLVEVMMALEDTFGIEIPEDEADGITTVGQAVEAVAEKLKG